MKDQNYNIIINTKLCTNSTLYQLIGSVTKLWFLSFFIGPLMVILSSSNSELVYVCLCHIELLLTKMPRLFDQEYRSFFSRLILISSYN